MFFGSQLVVLLVQNGVCVFLSSEASLLKMDHFLLYRVIFANEHFPIPELLDGTVTMATKLSAVNCFL